MGLILVGPIQQIGHSSIPDFLMPLGLVGLLRFVDHVSIPCFLIRLGLAWPSEDAEDRRDLVPCPSPIGNVEGLAILDPVI